MELSRCSTAECVTPAWYVTDMICPVCEAEAQRSIVTEHGVASTLMAIHAFFDEEGERHLHDMNNFTGDYSCNRGHRFGVTFTRLCPAFDCDYGEGPSVVKIYS